METLNWSFFIKFIKKCFCFACDFRYIFNWKLIIYPIAIVIEHSTEIPIHRGLHQNKSKAWTIFLGLCTLIYIYIYIYIYISKIFASVDITKPSKPNQTKPNQVNQTKPNQTIPLLWSLFFFLSLSLSLSLSFSLFLLFSSIFRVSLLLLYCNQLFRN